MTEIYEPEGSPIRCTNCDTRNTKVVGAGQSVSSPLNGSHDGADMNMECRSCGHLWELRIENRPTGAVRYTTEY